MLHAVGALVFAAVAAAAVVVGPVALAVVAVGAAVLALLDVVLLLGRGGVRVVVPVAAVPGVALPLLAALEREAADGWTRMGEVFALTVIGGFLLVLLFGRRRDIVVGVGAALAAGLLVGLGAASLVLLPPLPGGLWWALALVALAAAADAGGALVAGVQARRTGADPTETDPPGASVGFGTLGGALVAVAIGVAILLLAFDGPLAPWLVLVLAAAAAVAALGGDHLRRGLVVEAGGEGAVLGAGTVLGAVDAVFYAAPVAYILARSVTL